MCCPECGLLDCETRFRRVNGIIQVYCPACNVERPWRAQFRQQSMIIYPGTRRRTQRQLQAEKRRQDLKRNTYG